MKRLAGQAGHAAVIVIHRIGMLVMTVFLLILLAAGGLAYRLSLGPLEIPRAAAWLANAGSGEDVKIHIGTAQLAWAGYKKGSRAPLFLQLGQITVSNTGGTLLAAIPQAQLVFSLGALFANRAPIYVSSANARVIGSDVPIALLAGIRLGAAFTLESADLWVTLGAGRLGPAGFDEPVTGGRFQLSITPSDVRLDHGMVTLQPFGRSAPVLLVAASAHKSRLWQGTITLQAAAVQAADVQHYWPQKMVPITRNWVTSNITAGIARNARFVLGLSAPLHLATLHLDSASGGFDAENATLIWLQGVAPLTGLNGRFVLTDRDDIAVNADIGHLGGIALAHAKMHIAGVSQANQLASLTIPVSGTLTDAFKVLNGPGLALLKAVPTPIPQATGDMTGVVKVALPLQPVTTAADVKLNVTTVLTNVTLPLPVQGVTLRQGGFAVHASLRDLSIKGDARLFGEPASLGATVAFGAQASQINLDLRTILRAASLQNLGLDTGGFLHGQMPVQVHVATRPATGGSVIVQADLTGAELALPLLGWAKPAGQAGDFRLAARINGDLSGIDRIDSIVVKAPGFDVESAPRGKAIDLTYVRVGDNQGSGRIVPPAGHGQPWAITLAGTMLDLSAVVNPAHRQAAEPAGLNPNAALPGPRPVAAKIQPPSGFLWRAQIHFDRLRLAPSPEPMLTGFDFSGDGQGDFLFAGDADALAGGKPLQLTVTPGAGALGDAQALRLRANDAGALLRALGAFNDLGGGALDLVASYGVTVPVQGVTRITNFKLLNAPAFGKVLQAMTVLGIPEAASGPGLLFNRLVVPFTINGPIMTLQEARAYSASLGVTATGSIDLQGGIYDIHGTVVPAYALNTLPGRIPIIGRLFSPEKGGGLFAMRYSMTGPFTNPKVKINPLSALTPGFLRGIFSIGEKPQPK
jgi:hypothetical protein